MLLRLLVRTTIWIACLAGLLFIPAGTIRWPGAWVFLAGMAGGSLIIGVWLARHDPALLEERLSSLNQAGQERWDKTLIMVVVLLWCGWMVLMGLDAKRFEWSHVAPWAHAIGGVGLAISMYAGYLTFRENTFAAPVVKIQKDRGQTVISTGPYRWVRHPMYAGALFMFLGAPLLLGSWYGLAVTPILITGLGYRAVREERMLKEKLDGYAEYTARVRYRFIPGIW